MLGLSGLAWVIYLLVGWIRLVERLVGLGSEGRFMAELGSQTYGFS